MDSEIKVMETLDRRDIDEIEKIEKRLYKDRALTVDILVPAANFLGFITIAKTSKIVGYTVFLSTTNKNQMYCAALTVLPEYRKQGIATRLLEHGEKKCMELGIDSLIATANPKNIASCKTFLNRRNWYVIKLYKNFYRDGLNSFLFKKDLTKRRIKFSDKVVIDLNSTEQIISMLNKGYYGTRIIDNEKIQLQKVLGE